MTDTYRAMCAELTTALEYAWDGRRPKVVQELIDRARALLDQPTPQPVAASERLPSAADCDAEGNCWWFDPHADGAWYVDTFQSCYTHWLSANALPLPFPISPTTPIN